MSLLSSKLRKWADPVNGDEGLTYYCQGCQSNHSIKTKGNGAWRWNGDVDKPVFTPSVLVTWPTGNQGADGVWRATGEKRCHSFVGCNGAQPGEVIFLGDCTHELAGTVQPFPDLPDWMKT